jgi:hypothetical protein
MTHSQAFGLTHCLIRLLIVISLFISAGCGSRQSAPSGPPVDKDLERTNRAARTAFENGSIQQATGLYRQTLERAYLRDDLAAAIDAKYNLAVCLTLLQSDREALELVKQAGTARYSSAGGDYPLSPGPVARGLAVDRWHFKRPGHDTIRSPKQNSLSARPDCQ